MKKTYIPSTPRSRKLKSVGGGTINVSGGSAQNVPVIEGHTHDNKIILDAITQLHLRILSSLNVDEDGALIVELSNIIKELDTTAPTDENLFSALRTVLEIRARSISKTDPDTAQEIITFLKGIIASGTSKFDNIEVGNYTTGPLGAGAAIKMENGVSRMEVDQLDVRMRATFRELIIESLKHIGGQLILSPARMKCNKVVDGGTYYRCYFDTGDGKVSNEFVAGDQARCQVFTGSGVKMYWRLVTSVGTDWINLSKTDAISGSSIPEAGDDIVQLGNRSDATRQNAQILSTVGSDAPSWKQYKGINAFSLEGKDTTVFSGTGNKIDGKTVFMSSGANVEDGINSKNSNYSSQPTSYKANDTWTLSADQTVNGIAYKSGEILTATQDSTTFVQAHWVKKVRYTDDSAVNDLQIGGRNYFLNGSTVRTGSTFLEIKTDYLTELIGKQVVISFDIKSSNSATYNVYPYQSNGISISGTRNITTTTEYRRVSFVDTIKDWGTVNPSYTSGGIGFYNASGAGLSVKNVKIEIGNKATDYSEAPEDVQAAIDAAVVKATYWSVKASAPVIYKDAINAATAGSHTPVTVSGELRSGTTTTAGGFLTVTANGGTEAGTATASPVTIAPSNGDGKTSYTVRLYDTAAKTTLLDTMTIPVVFKGASGVNAINVVLSNEADVLPASPEGVVSDYTGSGAIIRVFEGATELDYDGIGTANGKFNVTASATGITAGTKSESGLTCVFANASNMTADNATIVFTIAGKTADGASFSLTKTQSFAKSRTGQKGDKGDKGDQGLQGIPGQNGADGVTYYTWVRYADTPTTGMSQYPTGKAYIGFAYNKTTPTESSTYSDYQWSLIKGEQGIPGDKGEDGTQYYTWIKYADTPTSGMSDSPTDKAYIGIAVNKTTATESTNYADYTWQLTKGEKGDAGVSITGVDVEFAKNTNPTTAPTTGWTTTAPTLAEGEQLWTRTKTTYSAGNPTYSTPANITPKKGDTGAVGQGVESVTEEYAISTSKTVQPTTGWDITQPAWIQGQYIWSRVKVVYKNPASTVYTGYAVSSEWEAVNNLQIGDINLLLGSNVSVTNSDYPIKTYSISASGTNLQEGEVVTAVVKGVIGAGKTSFELYNSGGSVSIIQIYPADFVNGIAVKTFAWKREYGATTADNSALFVYPLPSGTVVNSTIEWIKLVRGNKTSKNYTEAPEDIQARIDAEKTRINDILSDNVADPSEKQYLSNLWQEIYAEYPRIWAQANDYSVDKSSYEAKYTALNNLLSPVLANLTVNSTVSGASIRTAFSQYYDAKTFLLNNITNKVNQNAGDAAAVAADAQAKANISKAVTDKFSGFDGGLATAVIMEMREPSTTTRGDATAGISGIQKDINGNFLPAVWAGGTYAQAIDGLAKAIIKHNGKSKLSDTEITGVINALSGKVGVLTIEESGRVVLTDPDTHAVRLVFSESDIPLIADLVSGANDGDSASNVAQSNITVGYLLPNAITVGKNNSSIAFSASTFTVNANIANMMDYITVNVYLRKNGVNFTTIKSVQLYGPGAKSENTSITYGVDGVGTGTYDVFIEITKTNTLDTVSSYISASTLSWTYTQAGIRYFQFGVNGMMAFFSDNHWYFTETGGFDLRGATNMPGVLAAGSSTSGGAQTNVWGAKSSTAGVTTITSPSAGFRVPLSGLSHSNYVVQITPHTNTTFRVGTKTSTYFEIYGSGGFDYAVIGNNYA